jgi:diguanylate cyclase (GGDEF)-like protein
VKIACACLALMTSAVLATPPRVSPATLLQEADHAMSSDHARFVRLLVRLHGIEGSLTPEQQQLVRLLDAINNDITGHSTKAIHQYQEILEYPQSELIGFRARSALIVLLMQQQKYVEAYTLTNTLIAKMPRINDVHVRLQALKILIRVSNSEQRYDQAIHYADQLQALGRKKKYRCEAGVFRTQAMLYRGDSTSKAKADFTNTIETCKSANMLGFASSLRLSWGELLGEEGHADQSIAYLRRITPDLMRSGFKPYAASLQAFLSQAYLKKGDYATARRHALAALHASDPKRYNWTLQYTYRMLYLIDKHEHRFASALVMYKHYLEQYKVTMANAQAQALAYQMAKQDVLAKKLELRKLDRQNKILKLRQSLDRKSAETSGLQILLLLLILGCLVLWAFRTKHSQIRFRTMARHDDLTGVLNRQHFFDKAGHALNRLQKTGGHACLMILDMDHFKRINDVYGHVAGDTVLKHVVQTCRVHLHDSDVFGRLGGEEFGILMPDCSVARGMEIGERIRLSLARTPVRILESESVTVTSSIGLASTESHGHALKPLLFAADEALYTAKRGGRNRLMAHPREPMATRS